MKVYFDIQMPFAARYSGIVLNAYFMKTAVRAFCCFVVICSKQEIYDHNLTFLGSEHQECEDPPEPIC